MHVEPSSWDWQSQKAYESDYTDYVYRDVVGAQGILVVWDEIRTGS